MWRRGLGESEIRNANKACAVGRLMMGQLQSWEEFLHPDAEDLSNVPRRCLKAGVRDVRLRLRGELQRFCNGNFSGLTEDRMVALYADVKANRGLEMPLSEFEAKYARLLPSVLKDIPRHCTVVLSLWGLQFMYPEDYLSKDVGQSLALLSEAGKEIDALEKSEHHASRMERGRIAAAVRKRDHAARTCVLCCWGLLEAYLNGIAWDFMHLVSDGDLAEAERKLLADQTAVSLRKKLLRYPKLVTGRQLWDRDDPDVQGLLDVLKPFRDSLVHPSPFSAPAKFGGYDKLRLLYRISDDTAELTAVLTRVVIGRIHKHMHPDDSSPLMWLNHLPPVKND